jgi:hypothetical protein
MTKRKSSTVLERFLLPNPLWQEGYEAFSLLMGRPLGWLILFQDEGDPVLIRLDRKGNCPFYSAASRNEDSCEAFLQKYASMLARDTDTTDRLPCFYKCTFGKRGIVFEIRHLGKPKGYLILDAFKKSEKEIQPMLSAFDVFLSTHVELAYKAFELNNFYETVHPRALALSTMHSVHRVISSSLRLGELLPRIGRLSAQVLKAKGCSIMLCDMDHEYLLPRFSFGTNSKFIHQHRLRIGKGLEGRIARTGDFHLGRNSIAVPFIEDDVVGIIVLWDKVDRQPFTKTDLEILKSLSEQAVVAIKNARLYEETEQLTLGSIQTINELLELNFGGDRSQLAVFGEIIIEMGKALQLSHQELTQLQRAVILLDTGALAFPQKIWQKKGKLTKKEFELVKKIPMQGANILRSISSLKPVIPIVLHHRERYDGKGYPQGLQKEEIPIGARIVAVADSFMAMISRREYRQQKTIDEALRELQANKGTQFDPHVVDAFMEVVRQKPILEKLRLMVRNMNQKALADARSEKVVAEVADDK